MILRTRPSFPAFEDRFDRAFHQLTSSILSASPRTPAFDAAWTDGALQLTVDLPGTPEDAIQVDVAGRTLTIGVETDGLQWSRSVRLGSALDPEQVSAHYVHGRLTVTVAPAAAAEKRAIAIDTTPPAIESSATESPESAESPESN
jgi:HSP20 family molecular chaperone IbpA